MSIIQQTFTSLSAPAGLLVLLCLSLLLGLPHGLLSTVLHPLLHLNLELLLGFFLHGLVLLLLCITHCPPFLATFLGDLGDRSCWVLLLNAGPSHLVHPQEVSRHGAFGPALGFDCFHHRYREYYRFISCRSESSKLELGRLL